MASACRIHYYHRHATLIDLWAIDQSVAYGNMEILGVTGWYHAYEKYKAATGADYEQRTGLLTLTPEKYRALQPLHFHIGEQTYTLSPNAQIWPRHHNDQIDESGEDVIYLVIVDRNKPTDSGDHFVLGYVFLQRFYSVYDVTNSRVGFATTMWTDVDIN
ncbi:aspartic peptidase domain-containing protein [Suillus spraguei]|nr:aspartic peptidase domain-containing protein [Suillus spraguei]